MHLQVSLKHADLHVGALVKKSFFLNFECNNFHTLTVVGWYTSFNEKKYFFTCTRYMFELSLKKTHLGFIYYKISLKTQHHQDDQKSHFGWDNLGVMLNDYNSNFLSFMHREISGDFENRKRKRLSEPASRKRRRRWWPLSFRKLFQVHGIMWTSDVLISYI